jgi:hypothetical protein
MPSAAALPSVTSATTFSAIDITAAAVSADSAVVAIFKDAAVFTVTAAIYVISAIFAIFTTTAAISISSTSTSNRLPYLVNSVRLWSYYPLAPFPQSVTSI